MIRKAFDNGEPYIHNTTVECNKQEQKSLLFPGRTLYHSASQGKGGILYSSQTNFALTRSSSLARPDRLVHHSDFMASIADILVARSAGKKPESTPTIIPKNAAKKGSQNGMTENCEPSATPILPLMSDSKICPP